MYYSVFVRIFATRKVKAENGKYYSKNRVGNNRIEPIHRSNHPYHQNRSGIRVTTTANQTAKLAKYGKGIGIVGNAASGIEFGYGAFDEIV